MCVCVGGGCVCVWRGGGCACALTPSPLTPLSPLQVRSQALETVAEVYQHVGVKVRIDLSRRGLSSARLAQLNAKFDEIDVATNNVRPDVEVRGVAHSCDPALGPAALQRSSPLRTWTMAMLPAPAPATPQRRLTAPRGPWGCGLAAVSRPGPTRWRPCVAPALPALSPRRTLRRRSGTRPESM